MATTDNTPTLEQLQAQIAKLEKRVTKLEQERDEARENFVLSRLVRIVQAQGFFRYNDQHLPSEDIRLIRRGDKTLAQAVAERDAKYPLFRFFAGTMSLGDAYKMTV